MWYLSVCIVGNAMIPSAYIGVYSSSLSIIAAQRVESVFPMYHYWFLCCMGPYQSSESKYVSKKLLLFTRIQYLCRVNSEKLKVNKYKI